VLCWATWFKRLTANGSPDRLAAARTGIRSARTKSSSATLLASATAAAGTPPGTAAPATRRSTGHRSTHTARRSTDPRPCASPLHGVARPIGVQPRERVGRVEHIAVLARVVATDRRLRPSTQVTVQMGLRAPRVVYLVPAGQDWTFNARIALSEVTRLWGGAHRVLRRAAVVTGCYGPGRR